MAQPVELVPVPQLVQAVGEGVGQQLRLGVEPGGYLALVEVTEMAGSLQPAQRCDTERFRLGVGQQGITKASGTLQPQPVPLDGSSGQRIQISEAE
ncbi:hypothetical protein D3C80_1889060 [compost metagenome]